MPSIPEPLDAAHRIDAVCDRFEADWRAGTTPRIEDVLTSADRADRDALFRALLPIELELRGKAGESLGTVAFKSRFPEHAAAVMTVFRELAERRKPAGETSVSRESVRTIDQPRPAGVVIGTGPSRLGRFELVELLGEGAFGQVFRARDPHLDREVAIKVPRETVMADADRERFLREAKAAATVQHPNVCPIYEAGQDGDRMYIVMALIAGKSLSAMLKERKSPLPEKQAAQIVRKLALALDAAHAKGVVHRDLKPANVMFDRDRKDVVVMDFGLARRTAAGDAELTGSGVILGTPAYMAPEQARGHSKAVGPAADIYALGIILYEMLAGRRPFSGGVGEVIGQILHVEPEPPSKARPDVDPRLEAVCMKAIAKDPAGRYATMREFAGALSASFKEPAVPATGSAPTREVSAAPTTTDEAAGLQQLFAAMTDDRRQTVEAVEAALKKGRPPWWVWAVSSGFAGLVAVLGIIFFARTPTATVHITIDVNLQDRTLSYVLDGKSVAAAYFDHPHELKVGSHELLVKRGSDVVRKFTFTVSKDAGPRIELKEDASPPPTSPLAKTPPATSLRFFGVSTAGPARVVPAVAAFGNVLVDRGWLTSDEVVRAARDAHLPVILAFQADALHGIEKRILDLFVQYPGVVEGVCWEWPFFDKQSSEVVAEFGRILKARVPSIKYWVSYTQKAQSQAELKPIPAEVDVVVVNLYYAAAADAVRNCGAALSAWSAHAAGRPVVLQWTSWGDKPGLVPRIPAGTLQACVDTAIDRGLAGVMFDRFGNTPNDRISGIDTNEGLAREVREAGHRLGFGAATVAADGFVPLFNGKDLTGWDGLSGYWRPEDGAIVGQATRGQSIETMLIHKTRVTDFELRFSARLSANTVAGVRFRGHVVNASRSLVYGPDLPLNAELGGLYYLDGNGVQHLKYANRSNPNYGARRHDLNDFVLRVVGKHVTLSVNGTVSLEDDIPELPADGLLALRQNVTSGPGDKVEFRDILLKDLRPVAAAPKAAPPADDFAALQGNWVCTFEESAGKVWSDAELRQAAKTLAVSGERFVIRRVVNGQSLTVDGRFVLDPKTTPKAFDFFGKAATGVDIHLRGIYELDGDTFRLCYTTGENRPPRFGSRETGSLNLVFKREPAAAVPAPAAPRPDVGFVPLFNGKDLAGWDGLPGTWWVYQSAVYGKLKADRIRHTFLCTTKTYRDFELKFQVRLKDGKGNSGVQIRSKIIDPAERANRDV